VAFEWFLLRVAYQISTLLYCFNPRGEVLLMERAREPNKGLWSPCGGKLETTTGESPHQCGCREAAEELGLVIHPSDLHLIGLVSERGSAGAAGADHWLMFLFEVKVLLRELPPAHAEGHFAFFSREQLAELRMPSTDVEQIWPLVWQHRGGFFAAHCEAEPGRNIWTLEESRAL
jgi:8-oxo-dGTP diphosphatase